MNKIIVNFTPTGIIPMKTDTPYIPVSVEEIVEDVRKAYEMGITMVHLHARDEDGKPSHKKEIYAAIISGIRRFAPDLIICVSTSGRIFNVVEARAEVLDLDGANKPDMASLTLSSLNFNQVASMNTPEMIQALAKRMQERGIKPELEIFDLGMVNYMKYLIKKGLIKEPYYANVILGNIACAQADLLQAGCVVQCIPDKTYISFGAVGGKQLDMNALAVAVGYGARCGLEDNYWYDEDRTVLATNQSILKRIRAIIDNNDKQVMTSSELRKKLNLKPGYGDYGIMGSMDLNTAPLT